jgi:putative membrane protein
MRLGVIVAAVVGLALATAIAAYVGFEAVFAALSRVGWRGLALLCVYSIAPFFLLGTAWYLLAAGEPVRRWPVFIWGRIVRDSAGELLPFSHLGGFVIGARAVIERGLSPPTAFSTTVVDITTELIAQLGFTGVGLGLLAMRLGAHSTHNALVAAAAIGLLLSALGAAAFIAIQRRGGGLVERLITRFLPGAAAGTSQVVEAIDRIYDHPWRIAAAVTVHLGAWVASATGVWLALRLAGVGIDLTAILAIESLVGAIRSAAFVAPMGIGVQEASYALLGPLFGLGPELSLAVSLVKRARDLVIGVPALLTWQGLEGVRLVTAKRPDAPAPQ